MCWEYRFIILKVKLCGVIYNCEKTEGADGEYYFENKRINKEI